MSADFEQEIRSIFFQEAHINLEEAEESYLKLDENSPSDLIEKCFRLAHNLKGSAKAVGFSDISEFLHNIESFLLLIKNKTLSPTKQVGNLLLECNDRLRLIIDNLKENFPEKAQYLDLVEKINTIKDSLVKSQNIVLEKTSQNSIGQDNDIIFLNGEDSAAQPTFTPQSEELKANNTNATLLHNQVLGKTQRSNTRKNKKDLGDEFLRVPLHKIDKLHNYVGEMVILESMLKEELKIDISVTLKNYLRQLDKITKEVQDTVMSLRLIPIKPVFQKLSRTVRDTSEMLNKKIDLQFIGEDTEIDKFVLDEISDPLMHMVRNSVDHGIEDSKIRLEKNKPETGKIIVEATHEAGYLILNICDDGKGLNYKTLQEKAEQKGVIPKNLNLSKEQCYELIFAPGFSTKAEATEISGRGVGMDVVRTNIESLNGSIFIESEIDKGTKFKIKIPLSIGIMDAFVIECARETFVVPIHQIKETLNFSSSDIKHVTGMGDIILLRNEEIPLFDLGLGLAIPNYGKNKSNEKVILISQSKERKIGIVVDKIISIQSVVTKALGDELRIENGIIGSVILGDGKAVPILETNALLKNNSFLQNIQRNQNRILL